MYLDAILVDEPLVGGLAPRLGKAHLRTLTVMGFPSVTYPGILDDLNRLAIPTGGRPAPLRSTRPTLRGSSPASAANGSPRASR